MCVYMYIYIYIYIERERERDRERATYVRGLYQTRQSFENAQFVKILIRDICNAFLAKHKIKSTCSFLCLLNEMLADTRDTPSIMGSSKCHPYDTRVDAR